MINILLKVIEILLKGSLTHKWVKMGGKMDEVGTLKGI